MRLATESAKEPCHVRAQELQERRLVSIWCKLSTKWLGWNKAARERSSRSSLDQPACQVLFGRSKGERLLVAQLLVVFTCQSLGLHSLQINVKDSGFRDFIQSGNPCYEPTRA